MHGFLNRWLGKEKNYDEHVFAKSFNAEQKKQLCPTLQTLADKKYAYQQAIKKKADDNMVLRSRGTWREGDSDHQLEFLLGSSRRSLYHDPELGPDPILRSVLGLGDLSEKCSWVDFWLDIGNTAKAGLSLDWHFAKYRQPPSCRCSRGGGRRR